jgi:hypothetical protein
VGDCPFVFFRGMPWNKPNGRNEHWDFYIAGHLYP